MKAFIQLLPIVNGERVEGRKAWICKEGNNLMVDNIYITKDTASELTVNDIMELKIHENKGLLKVMEIYKR